MISKNLFYFLVDTSDSGYKLKEMLDFADEYIVTRNRNKLLIMGY